MEGRFRTVTAVTLPAHERHAGEPQMLLASMLISHQVDVVALLDGDEPEVVRGKAD